jgi:ATP-binding cassette subfamily B protein
MRANNDKSSVPGPAISTLLTFISTLYKLSPIITSFTLCVRIVRALVPAAALVIAQRIIAVVMIIIGHRNYDTTIIRHLEHEITWLLIAEFALAMVVSVLGVAQFELDQELNAKFSANMNVRVIDSLRNVDLLTRESADFQNNLTRAKRQTAPQIRLLSQIFSPVQEMITCISMTVGIAYYFIWPAIFIAASTVPTIFGEKWFNELSFKLNEKQTERNRNSEYLRQLASDPVVAKEVMIFDLTDFLIGKISTAADDSRKELRQLGRLRAAWEIALSIIGNVVYFSCYVFAVVQTIEGRINIANLTFLLGAFVRLQSSLVTVLRGVGNVGLQANYLDDLFSFLAANGLQKRQSRPGADVSKDESISKLKEITFDHVSFKYPGQDKWALNDINFSIKDGETIGLVGVNGSGKTTLAKLLCGLYEPTSGRILLDGKELSNDNRYEYFKNIAGIFQDFACYNLTIKENIGVGRVNRIEDVESVQRSAQLMGADKIAEKFPAGIEQRLGRGFKDAVAVSGP